MKNEKGITLIALVITIIVMLILVTVTIRVATDGALFTHAANAAKGTKQAVEEENAILEGNIGNKTIESIVREKSGIISFTIDGTTFYADEGMTFTRWVNSNYNTAGLRIIDNLIYPSDTRIKVLNALPNDVINENGVYVFGK